MGQTKSCYDRAQFLVRYARMKDKTFNTKMELLVYCMDDVNVLRQACCAFRNLFLNLVEINPFRHAKIISSICNKVFCTMLLKQNSVGINLRCGYRMGNSQSVEVLQRLACIGRTRDNIFMPVMGGKFIRLGSIM